jgi:hypothetical protein
VTSARAVIEAFRGGPRAYPVAYPLLLGLADEDPGELPVLAGLILDELAEGGAFFAALLAWLSTDDLAVLAGRAVAALGRPGQVTQAAQSVIDHVSLQLPGALTRHLPRLWDLDRGRGGYFYSATWPWRGADPAEVRRLASVLADDSQSAAHLRAWICLLQGRTAEAWALAWQHRGVAAPLGAAACAGLWHAVGADPSPGPSFRPLVTAPAYHLVIPPEALAPRRLPWHVRQHPTWGDPGSHIQAASKAVTGGYSGAQCARGHGPLRRLLLLDPPPPGCAAAGRPRLDLAYCFSCADGWEPAFHLHDAGGRPHPLDHGTRKLPLNPFEGQDARPAVTAKVMRTPPRWQHQDWVMANDRENLNRLGGEPTWIQDPTHPACPSCQAAMPFLAQLDWSHLQEAEGITYILWCQPCAISAIIFQCT